MEEMVSRMVGVPSIERMQKFYTALAAANIGRGLEVKEIGLSKGKGIVARRTFEEGDVVLIEPPLVASQDSANKADALVCAHCFQYVGSIELQIGRRLTNNGETPTLDKQVRTTAVGSESDEVRESGLDECEERDGEGGHCCEDDESEEDRTPADPATVAALLEGTLKLPLSADFPLPGVVECSGGCSENVYCGATCRDVSWEVHHRLLCIGPWSEAADVEALRGFKEFADVSNNIFHVAAQVVAAMVLRARRGGGPTIPEHLVRGPDSRAVQTDSGVRTDENVVPDTATVSNRVDGQEHGDGLCEGEMKKVEECAQENNPVWDGDSDALLRAWEPFSMGWKGVWWESVACPPEMAGNPGEEAAFRTSIRELCEGSLELLRTAFGQEAETFGPLFSLEVYSRIIGMFELNNLALVVPSPVENYFLAIDDLPEDEKGRVESVTKPLLDALGRGYATHCEGTAFYTLQSCANHSCDPNARAFKREEDVNGHAVLLANRRIECGEEVTISYIDETDSYVDRQSALADYGFVCRCSKCETESLPN